MRFYFFVLIGLLCFSGCTAKMIEVKDATEMKDRDLMQTLRRQIDMFFSLMAKLQ